MGLTASMLGAMILVGVSIALVLGGPVHGPYHRHTPRARNLRLITIGAALMLVSGFVMWLTAPTVL